MKVNGEPQSEAAIPHRSYSASCLSTLPDWAGEVWAARSGIRRFRFREFGVCASKKRARVDIYADILEVLKHRPEGALVTRISYGAGLPLDRVKPMLETLANFGLLSIRVSEESRFYHITRRGIEFLDAYRKVQGFMTYLGNDQPQSR